MENYEQKYKEALERVRMILTDRDIALHAKEKLIDIFPELKESKDDRIRKAILTGLIDCRDAPDLGWTNFGGISIDKCINWIEKL